ncbi:hypothetical protein PR003_g30980 [Phytophthora rubi]|uniref:Uncharacterized protein n=1 Tax=Phytophthora rubi TaxID=129364 RepID=A0A6A3KBM8_9STRA|nr:hypothetical protein PR002_g29783 [Phytophthora rubi]KAE9004980.1 hypothetical protein PR001_g17575 [Phytophthora rubi]KAE9269979.1 hypothetical protein PR003_g30980 [Phytophthora rubi]
MLRAGVVSGLAQLVCHTAGHVQSNLSQSLCVHIPQNRVTPSSIKATSVASPCESEASPRLVTLPTSCLTCGLRVPMCLYT